MTNTTNTTNTSYRVLGDTHLGRQFVNNVPLHRRGDHEKIVWAKFREQLVIAEHVDVLVHMGDLFDKAVVPYSVVYRAADEYLTAARNYPETEFVILRGNHDTSRDLQAVSAFDLFTMIVRNVDNIVVVDEDWQRIGDLVFFSWHPVTSADAIVEDFINNYEADVQGMTAFGHWDVDPRSDPFNMIPTEQLAFHGITKAYTGHDHLRREFDRDDVHVNVVGSMLPFAHGEDAYGTTYVTLTLDEARTATDLKDKCVRVKLEPGEVFDLELDCLQLQVQRADAEAPLEVELGEFDLGALFELSMETNAVPETIRAELRLEWSKGFTTKL